MSKGIYFFITSIPSLWSKGWPGGQTPGIWK